MMFLKGILLFAFFFLAIFSLILAYILGHVKELCIMLTHAHIMGVQYITQKPYLK